MTVFDPPEETEEDLLGVKPDGDDGEDGTGKGAATDVKDFSVPDDYEDEDLRGLSGLELLQTLKHSKELTKRAIEEAKTASGAATAAATAATAVATAGVTPTAAVGPTEITKEDLLLADPAIVNQKIAAIFAEKARPVIIEQYTKMSHQALALAKTDTKNMPYWEEYEDEIVASAGKLSVDVTSNIDTWKTLYNQIIAGHQSEIIDREVAKRAKKSGDDDTDGAGGGGGAETKVGRRVRVVDTGETGKGGGGKKGDNGAASLNDEQKRTADLLGVPHEDYAKYAIEEE